MRTHRIKNTLLCIRTEVKHNTMHTNSEVETQYHAYEQRRRKTIPCVREKVIEVKTQYHHAQKGKTPYHATEVKTQNHAYAQK